MKNYTKGRPLKIEELADLATARKSVFWKGKVTSAHYVANMGFFKIYVGIREGLLCEAVRVEKEDPRSWK